jgi:hypothetical protein
MIMTSGNSKSKSNAPRFSCRVPKAGYRVGTPSGTRARIIRLRTEGTPEREGFVRFPLLCLPLAYGSGLWRTLTIRQRPSQK